MPYHMKHNAEPEACDLLMEVDLLPEIKAREHFPFEGHSFDDALRSAPLRSALHCTARCTARRAAKSVWRSPLRIDAGRLRDMRSPLAHTAVHMCTFLYRHLPACPVRRAPVRLAYLGTCAGRPAGLLKA